MEETDCLHANKDSGKPKVNVIIVGWACSKMDMAFKVTVL